MKNATAAPARDRKGDIALSSRLTGQCQVLVPKVVRQVLGVSKGDTLEYIISAGEVTVRARRDSTHRDPAIESFLSLLTDSISGSKVSSVTPTWLRRARATVEGIDFDRNETLEGSVDLG